MKTILSAGRTDQVVNALVKHLSKASKAFVAVSVGISVYNVTTAENKTQALQKEAGGLAGSVIGGAAGGAAGLVCGPAAFVCTPLGTIIGAIAGGFGGEEFAMWKP